MESLQTTICEMKSMFTSQLAEFQKSLEKATPSTTVSALAADYSQFKKFIALSLANLQKQVDCLALECDRIETRSRRKMVLLHGVPEAKGEETKSIVSKMASERLRVTLTPDAIARSHRMGRTVGSKPRPILIKFSCAVDRDRIWFAKTSLKSTGITMSEFLTKSRHGVFMEARKRLGIEKCWTRNGVVVVAAPGGAQHRIATLDELDKIAPPAQTPVPSPVAGESGKDASHIKSKRPKKNS